jgi:hypothetical protein
MHLLYEFRLVEKHAFFVFRVKENLLFTVTETLELSMPESTNRFFDSVSDELIRYTNDKTEWSCLPCHDALNESHP